MVNLNALGKQKKLLLFQFWSKKNLIMAKQLRKNQSLLIPLDVNQAHYQDLLIIY